MVERRKHSDLFNKILMGLNIACWLTFLAALVMFHYARPEIEYGIIRYFNLSVREGWLHTPKEVLIALLYVCAGLSLLTIVLNRFRARRQSDSLKVNLITLLIISLSFLLVVSL
ncbi:hypothetical protein [Pseudoalteromonas tunicata]|uniref:hypothetical protein n=1 Tax=Pseudoalteromonas tunicata TaxID=314281 RepID=UPI0003091D8F|nr:hypothetical protein [Pseudoalteromonas tunicata]ATC94591.1 hypothetical protein PTUN_a2055 [Pseudoalteromonas tunicata]MDP4984457.1 hypothetical protein [Pseudoalteromonas tunicata]MDP5212109.1 hypothetical protein [Pseudoalteromonas tunicata]